MHKKRILHFITGVELGGGAENMLLQLLPKMQDGLDNRVCAIMGRGEVGKKLEEKGITVYYLDLKSIFDFGVIWRYRKMLKGFNPDVQVNYLVHADIFGRIFGKLFGVKKTVSYIRNIHRKMPVLMFLDKLTIGLCDFVLTNSEVAKKYYVEKMGTKNNKIMCIPNGVDVSRFGNVQVDKELKLKELGIKIEASIDASKVIIGSIARLEKQKDIPTLIKAFEKISQENHNVHLLLIGQGKLRENIQELRDELGIGKKVTMLENRKDIAELLGIMDIFVLPSLNEGMSNALLEAMAAGKMIITSDIPENMELVEDGKEGLNFEAGNPRDLADRIRLVIKNQEVFKKCQEAAFRKVSNKYDLDIIREGYKNFLIDL